MKHVRKRLVRVDHEISLTQDEIEALVREHLKGKGFTKAQIESASLDWDIYGDGYVRSLDITFAEVIEDGEDEGA